MSDRQRPESCRAPAPCRDFALRQALQRTVMPQARPRRSPCASSGSPNWQLRPITLPPPREASGPSSPATKHKRVVEKHDCVIAALFVSPGPARAPDLVFPGRPRDRLTMTATREMADYLEETRSAST